MAAPCGLGNTALSSRVDHSTEAPIETHFSCFSFTCPWHSQLAAAFLLACTRFSNLDRVPLARVRHTMHVCRLFFNVCM